MLQNPLQSNLKAIFVSRFHDSRFRRNQFDVLKCINAKHFASCTAHFFPFHHRSNIDRQVYKLLCVWRHPLHSYPVSWLMMIKWLYDFNGKSCNLKLLHPSQQCFDCFYTQQLENWNGSSNSTVTLTFIFNLLIVDVQKSSLNKNWFFWKITQNHVFASIRKLVWCFKHFPLFCSKDENIHKHFAFRLRLNSMFEF